MELKRDRLCLITPDNFYAVLLRQVEFPTFDIKVIGGIAQLASLAIDFYPDVFLLFASHLGPSLLARTTLEVRSKFPNAEVFQIEGVQEPHLELLWSSKETEPAKVRGYPAYSVEQIDAGIRAFTDPRLEADSKLARVTSSQLEVIELLARGLANSEIARERNTSIRAVQTLINRSLKRIGAGENLNARGQIILAQKYLQVLDETNRKNS